MATTIPKQVKIKTLEELEARLADLSAESACIAAAIIELETAQGRIDAVDKALELLRPAHAAVLEARNMLRRERSYVVNSPFRVLRADDDRELAGMATPMLISSAGIGKVLDAWSNSIGVIRLREDRDPEGIEYVKVRVQRRYP